MRGFSRNMLMCLLCVLSLNTAHTGTSITTGDLTPKGNNNNTKNAPPTVDVFNYIICEDTPVGDYAFTIVASDVENDPLTYSVTGINAGFFTVVKSTGVVTVKKQLDREANNVMQLGVIVSDGFSSNLFDIFVVLADDNDNEPLFEEVIYYDCPENTPVGSSLFKVKATDKDIGSAGDVQYSISEVIPNSGLGLFSISSSSGEVTLAGRLSYTEMSTLYWLRLNATDGGGRCYFNETTYLSSSTFAIITVVDVPDLDPKFLGAPYTARVPEKSPVGQSVLKVTAVDQDTEVNDKVIYTIEDSSADGLFGILYDEGVIYVVSEIDREDLGVTDTVTLTVKATESKQNIYGVYGSNTTIIPIKILVNFNKPLFYMCGLSCVRESHFTAKVSEHYVGLIHINMTVRDLDKVSNTKLTLGGPDSHVFAVEPQFTEADSIVQLVVRQPQKLDFEQTHQMILEVIATDQYDISLCSTATVTINIQDINDNKPEFNSSNRVFPVESESTSKGTPVAEVTATDQDSGVNGQIKLKVTAVQFTDSNNQTHNMRLLFEAVTERQNANYVGTIQTTEKLNVTLKGKYWVTVTATDTGGLFTSTVLEIFTVNEVNEVQLEFSFSVEEVEEELEDITRVLSAATNATIEIVSIIPATSTTGAIIIAHFVYPNGTTLTADEVKEIISDPEYSSELEDLGLTAVRDGSLKPHTQMPILLGMFGGPLVVVAVLATSFIYSHRNYIKLEIAKAMKSANMVDPDNHRRGPVVPGTNEYTIEGTNPLYDQNNILDPDLEERNKSSDVDAVSVSSWDFFIDLRAQPTMNLIQEEE